MLGLSSCSVSEIPTKDKTHIRHMLNKLLLPTPSTVVISVFSSVFSSVDAMNAGVKSGATTPHNQPIVCRPTTRQRTGEVRWSGLGRVRWENGVLDAEGWCGQDIISPALNKRVSQV